MRLRVDALVPGHGRGTWVSTFHAFCAQFIRVEAKNMGLDSNFVIYDDKDQLSVVKETLKEMMIEEKQCPPSQIVNAISRAKDELLDAGSYLIHAQAHNDPFRERVGRVYESYQSKLKTANALDFGDLIMKTVEALRDHEALRTKYQKRFQYLMVDEYQDTNHAQYLLMKLVAGPSKNICVVGDDDQSIYSWRGATIRNILEFERDYAGAKVVKLEQNYRSTPNILKAASTLIAFNEKRKAKTIWTENKKGEDIRYVEMMNEQEEARFVIDELISLQQKRKVELKDVAIFYRTNAQSRVFEDALRRATLPYVIVGALRFYERAEIKDTVSYLRSIVNPKDNISIKRIVNVPARGLGKNSLGLIEQYAASQGISLFEGLQNSHAISGLSPAARRGIKIFLGLREQFSNYATQFPASTVVRRVLEESGYWDHWADKADDDPEAQERLDNLQELINAAKDFESSFAKASEDVSSEALAKEDSSSIASAKEDGPAPRSLGEGGDDDSPQDEYAVAQWRRDDGDKSIARFLQEISLLSDLDEWKDSGGTVTLMTVHLAKGLEYPTVFVTGLEEGLFPIGDTAFDQDELEEERRLGYVAMTRAKEKLYLTCAASRRIFGSPRMNIPSRFIEEAGISTKPSTQPTSGESYSQTANMAEYDFNQTPDEERSPIAPEPESTMTALAKWARVGALVKHPDFGVGKITSKEGSGSATKITVRFPNGLSKKLLLKYAPVQII